MSSPVNSFDPVHDDLVNTLFNEAWANQVSIFKIVDKRIDSEVKKAAIGGRNGGCGSTIEVLSPLLAAPSPNSGRIMELRMAFMVKDWDTLSQGAHGTGLTGQDIAQNLIQTFWLHSMVGVTGGFYPDPDCFSPVPNPDSAYKLYSVKFRAAYDLGTYPRVAMPGWTDGALSGGNRTLTLVDTQAGGGSTLYYTTDGTLPCPLSAPGGPANSASVYAAPIAVPVGTFLRVKAYNSTPVNGLVPLASNVQGITVS